MRRRELILWSVIALSATGIAILALFTQVLSAVSPIGIEVIGTLDGFLLALSIAELLKIDEKKDRENHLTVNLVEEVETLTRGFDETSIVVVTDMWDMAISSGDLCLFHHKKRQLFKDFYRAAKLHRENRIELNHAYQRGIEDPIILESQDKLFTDKIVRTSKRILKEYGKST